MVHEYYGGGLAVRFYEVLNLSYNPHATNSFEFSGPVLHFGAVQGSG